MAFTRIAGIAGLAAAALMVAGGVLGNLGGMPPGPGAPAAQVTSYYRTSGQATLFSAVANAFSAIALLLLAGGFRMSLSARAQEGWTRLGFAGGGIFAAMLIVVSAIQLALPASVSEPAAAVALATVWQAGVAMLGVSMVPLLVGFGVSAIQAESWPSWTGWIALVGAVAGSIGSLAAALSGPVAGIASLLGFIQYPALFLWLVGSSLAITRPAVGDTG